MRIRLVHTQSLMLLAAVLIAVLAMGSLSAWNLRNGFTDFLSYREEERLAQFAELISTQSEEAGGLAALAQKVVEIEPLMEEFAKSQDGFSALRPKLDQITEMVNRKPALTRPTPIDSIDAFKVRIGVYDQSGRFLLGRKLSGSFVESPVRLQGEVVGTVRMLKLKPVPNHIEMRFLNTQYLGIAAISSVLLLLALVCARWAAGHWVRPLTQVQEATQKIALGAFDTRLNDVRSDEIGDTMRNINRMAQGLQRLESTRRRWLADMSHELRTPLTVLRGEIDALIDGVIPFKPEALLSLREEVQQLNALVGDLHLLAMSDLKALPCYFEAADAIQVAQNVQQRFALKALKMGLQLELTIDPVMCAESENSKSIALPVRWDAKRIEQLLGNLVDNSLRYTDVPGRVVLSISARDEHIHYCLQDTPPGVDAANLSRLFEPLYRADTARSRQTGGSGLGLAICLAIAESHRGHLSVSSSALGGLRIDLKLPLTGERNT